MEIVPVELIVIIEDEPDFDLEKDDESGIGMITKYVENLDTRKHTFFELSSYGECLDNNMDISIIFSDGSRCSDLCSLYDMT